MSSDTGLVETIVWFKNEQQIVPLKFRYKKQAIKIDRILSHEIQNRSGEMIHVYRCLSIFNGVCKEYQLKFLVSKATWHLFLP
jgi:hypothetical protein